jgi:hypothetical protein
MYRFSLKLKNNNLSRLRSWQKELKTVLGQHFSMNELIEALLEQGLNLIEIDNGKSTNKDTDKCKT